MIGYGHEVWSAGNYYFWVRLLNATISIAAHSGPHNFVHMLTVVLDLQVPMVAPFFGVSFGGFLYDTFLFTGEYLVQRRSVAKLTISLGESPINTPWLGLKRVIQPKREDWSTYAAARKEKNAKDMV